MIMRAYSKQIDVTEKWNIDIMYQVDPRAADDIHSLFFCSRVLSLMFVVACVCKLMYVMCVHIKFICM